MKLNAEQKRGRHGWSVFRAGRAGRKRGEASYNVASGILEIELDRGLDRPEFAIMGRGILWTRERFAPIAAAGSALNTYAGEEAGPLRATTGMNKQ